MFEQFQFYATYEDTRDVLELVIDPTPPSAESAIRLLIDLFGATSVSAEVGNPLHLRIKGLSCVQNVTMASRKIFRAIGFESEPGLFNYYPLSKDRSDLRPCVPPATLWGRSPSILPWHNTSMDELSTVGPSHTSCGWAGHIVVEG